MVDLLINAHRRREPHAPKQRADFQREHPVRASSGHVNPEFVRDGVRGRACRRARSRRCPGRRATPPGFPRVSARRRGEEGVKAHYAGHFLLYDLPQFQRNALERLLRQKPEDPLAICSTGTSAPGLARCASMTSPAGEYSSSPTLHAPHAQPARVCSGPMQFAFQNLLLNPSPSQPVPPDFIRSRRATAVCCGRARASSFSISET